MNHRVTMADIARAAEVSKMTVSLALRNHPSLPPETSHRIQDMARSLGYRPNPLVAALMTELRTSKTKIATTTIAYVTSVLPSHTWMQSPTHRKFFTGASERAESLGYRLEAFNLATGKMNNARLANILWHRNIRGIIFAPASSFTADLKFDYSPFSTVALGFSIPGMKVHRVANHHSHTMTLALDNLRACGYRRLAVVLHERDNPRVDYGWLAGYDVFLRRHSDFPNIPPLLSISGSKAEFRRWFDKWKPDGIATLDLNVEPWLRTMKVRVPQDIGVAMLNAHPEENKMSGTIQHCEVIGATAADLVAEEMNHNHLGIPVYPKTVYIESDWIAGTSTRPVQ